MIWLIKLQTANRPTIVGFEVWWEGLIGMDLAYILHLKVVPIGVVWARNEKYKINNYFKLFWHNLGMNREAVDILG
jgi:hypothetical protein